MATFSHSFLAKKKKKNKEQPKRETRAGAAVAGREKTWLVAKGQEEPSHNLSKDAWQIFVTKYVFHAQLPHFITQVS